MRRSFTALHAGVVSGAESALEELVHAIRPLLCRQLRSAFRRVATHVIVDAVDDAIVDYALRPTQFDQTRGTPLERFLYCAAWRNLVDALDANRRRQQREAWFAQSVRLARRGAADDDDEASSAASRMYLCLARTMIDGTEAEAFAQWWDGERRTAALAAALCVTHLPLPEQRKEVKRFKDRILKRLDRIRTGSVHP